MSANKQRRSVLKRTVSRALSNGGDYNLIHRKLKKKKSKGTALLGLIDTGILRNENTSLGPQLSIGKKLAEKVIQDATQLFRMEKEDYLRGYNQEPSQQSQKPRRTMNYRITF